MDLDQPENKNFTDIILSTMNNNELYLCFGGGVGSFGRNFTIFHFNKSTVWIDIGCGFPAHNLPGLQRSIPANEILDAFTPRAIILTHGHEDHIGAIPYIYQHLNEGTPIYASNFTIALVKRRLREFKIHPDFFKFIPIELNTSFQVDDFTFSAFFVPHSIPQTFSVGIEIKQLNYKGFFTSDFKTHGTEKNYSERQISQFGPIQNLFCDSTGSLNSGTSSNETEVIKNIEKIIQNTKGRVFFTTFASQIERLSELGKIAKKYSRKIGIRGQSILTHLDAALEAGILKDPFWEIKRPESNDPNVIWIISGCQADPGSSFQRFSENQLPGISPEEGDTIIYSASIIPSNTDFVMSSMNSIAKKGARIIGLAEYDPKVHSSGHARSDDLKKFISILKPSVIIPVHGDPIHFQGFNKILENSSKASLHPLEDHCLYSINESIKEVMRIPAIPQLIEENEVHTEYSLYSYRINLSQSGICNLVLKEDTKEVNQIQFIGTSSQEWLKICMPELKEKIQSLVHKHCTTYDNNRYRKLKQKIAKINVKILGKNPYVNIIWI